MAKNSTVSDLVNKPFKITEDLGFKDIMRFKAIAAIVLKFAIPELRDKTLIEIARLIKDERGRKAGMTDAEVLDDEIDFLPSEAGVKDEKQTRNDTVFKILLSGNEIPVGVAHLGKALTVNTEMQNKTTNLGYDLISRAIYYGASLLRDTVPAGDSEYKGMHKVYSVWLCNAELPNIWLREGLKERYVHTYSMWRSYDNWKQVYKDDQADLMQIVMVELPKLKEKDGEAARMLYKLLNDTQNIVSEIERVAGVTLLKARKGVGRMIELEVRADRAEAKAVEAEAKAVEAEAKAVEAEAKAVEAEAKAVEAEAKAVEAEAKAVEAEVKAVRSIVKSWRRCNQECTAVRTYVLEEYPDVDLNLLDRTISEVYAEGNTEVQNNETPSEVFEKL